VQAAGHARNGNRRQRLAAIIIDHGSAGDVPLLVELCPVQGWSWWGVGPMGKQGARSIGNCLWAFNRRRPLAAIMPAAPRRGDRIASLPVAVHESASGTKRTFQHPVGLSATGRIVLQNSKVAAVQIFGENLKRKEVDDSHSFSRATEVAHEFVARRRGPSDHYTKNAPAAPRIFDTSCKTTFATQSEVKPTSALRLSASFASGRQSVGAARSTCRPQGS
jgi:hypothetical protein